MNDWFGGVSFSRLEWSGVGGGGVAVDGLVDWFELSCVTVRIIVAARRGVLESLLAFCRVCAISWLLYVYLLHLDMLPY